jgi:glycosyltransferase involved in cell wall biosynthesis
MPYDVSGGPTHDGSKAVTAPTGDGNPFSPNGSGNTVIRILHVARYRNESMEKKISFMMEQKDLKFFLVRPKTYEDVFGHHDLTGGSKASLDRKAVALVGRPNDPHRAFYGTCTFSMGTLRPHIIHAEEEPDSLAAFQITVARRLFAPRAKLVLHTYQNVNRQKSRPVRLVLALTLGAADAIFCANRDAVNVLREMGYAGPAPVVLPEGVDTEVFKPAASLDREGPFTVLYAGRFVEEKGITLLLEAVQAIDRDVKVLLVGAGPGRGTIEEQVQQLNLSARVEFESPRPASEMPKIFARVDALVLPSLATAVWKEQFGRVLVEAMACRIPVIGSSSGAIPDVIGNAGLLFAEGSRDGLARSLVSLIDSPALRTEYSERGFRRVQEFFAQERVAEKTLRSYRDLLL